MPDDTTNFLTKPDGSANESHFMGITIRAWLALALIIGGVVVMEIAKVAVVIICVCYFKLDAKDAIGLLEVKEPLYTMSGMALAYYFGNTQQKAKQ